MQQIKLLRVCHGLMVITQYGNVDIAGGRKWLDQINFVQGDRRSSKDLGTLSLHPHSNSMR